MALWVGDNTRLPTEEDDIAYLKAFLNLLGMRKYHNKNALQPDLVVSGVPAARCGVGCTGGCCGPPPRSALW